jgi:hypothetical protein
MTDRVWQKLDLETGKLETLHTTTSAETLEERFDGMLAQGREQLGQNVEVLFMDVRCDGCDAIVELEGPPRLPPGWSTSESGDFCPSCTQKGG